MADTVDTVPHVHLIPIMRCCRLWVRGWCLGPGSPWFWSVSFVVRTIRPPPDKKKGPRRQDSARKRSRTSQTPTCPRQAVCATELAVVSGAFCTAIFRPPPAPARGTRASWFVRVWSRKGGEWLMPVSDGLSQRKGTGQALNTGPMGGPCWLRFVSNAGTDAHPWALTGEEGKSKIEGERGLSVVRAFLGGASHGHGEETSNIDHQHGLDLGSRFAVAMGVAARGQGPVFNLRTLTSHSAALLSLCPEPGSGCFSSAYSEESRWTRNPLSTQQQHLR